MELEYQTLRSEIGRLQNQAARTLEIGIILTSSLFAISYTSVISENSQWIVLLSPSFLMIPFIYLILSRVKTTWIIGRYIEFNLEPRLGLEWEAYNRYLRGGEIKLFTSNYARLTIMPLIAIQMTSPLLSLYSGVPSIWIWTALLAMVIIIIALEIRSVIGSAITHQDVEVINESIIKFKESRLQAENATNRS